MFLTCCLVAMSPTPIPLPRAPFVGRTSGRAGSASSQRADDRGQWLPSMVSMAHSAVSVSSFPRLLDFPGGLRRVSPSRVSVGRAGHLLQSPCPIGKVGLTIWVPDSLMAPRCLRSESARLMFSTDTPRQSAAGASSLRVRRCSSAMNAWNCARTSSTRRRQRRPDG